MPNAVRDDFNQLAVVSHRKRKYWLKIDAYSPVKNREHPM